MRDMTRRSAVQLLGAAAATAQAPLRPAPWPSPSGRLRPRPSAEVRASSLSIGFETLDRKMFDPERTYPHLAQLGVKWARAQTGWARTERTRGEYDFGWLDSVVDSLHRIGVQPWFNLGYGNRLYTPEAPDESAVGWAPLWNEQATEAWLRYTRHITEHFRTRVRHWEIWNEPNIPNFWKPREPDPADYVELVRRTAPEIRKRVPDAVIIGGALTRMPLMLDYLERCLELGMAAHIDKFSYHPYRAVPEANYEAEIRALRALLARYKTGIELWQGENGCPSENGGTGALSNLDWNESRQAKWLLRRILTDLRVGIELTSYFHTVDMVNYNWGGGSSGRTNFKGVLRGNSYTAKPSYYAYQCLCALFDAEATRTDLLAHATVPAGTPVEPSMIQTAAFVRQESPLFVYWYPADTQKEFTPVQIRVALRPGKGRMQNPVLVDPLTATVYRIEKAERNGSFLILPSVPLTDYPLIVTDSAAAPVVPG